MSTKDQIKLLFVDDVSARAEAVREFVMDKANSYEDRLEVWKETPEHLQHGDSSIFHHPTMDDDDWMQYDWWNRGQKVDLTDIPEYQYWNEDSEKVKEFYEGCIDEGMWFFEFDW